MYCPECGKQNNDNVKFCYNCGTNLTNLMKSDEKQDVNLISPKTSSYHSVMFEEYTSRLKSSIFNAYIRGENIEPQEFYKKAEHYEMDTFQVNEVFIEFNNVIEKINRYISQLYLGNFRLILSSNDKEELFNYCSMFNLSMDDANKLLNKYNCSNNIELIQKFIDLLIREYEQGSTVDSKSLNWINDVTQNDKQKILEEFNKRIQQIEKQLENHFAETGKFFLSDEQEQSVLKTGIALDFSESEMRQIILGYEKKSGILRKRELAKQAAEIIQEQIDKADFVEALENEIETKTFTLFEQSIIFDGRYLFGKYVKERLFAIAKEAEEKYEEIKHFRRSMSNICDVLYEFEEKAYELLEEIDAKFHVSAGEEICNSISNYVEEQDDKILFALEEIGEIEHQTELEKQYRRQRKDSRGRWVGGGFGVKGAVKGAMTAGAMNMATGAAHSVFNAFGNFISDMSAVGKEDEIWKVFDEIPPKLMEFMKSAAEKIVSSARERYSDELWKENKEQEEELRNRLTIDSEEVKREAAIELLYSNPFNKDNYLFVLMEVQDKTCFEVLDTISWVFGISLQAHVKKYLERALEENLLSDKVWANVRTLKYKVYKAGDLRKFNLKLYHAVNRHITYSKYEEFYPKFSRLMTEMEAERREKNETFWGSMLEGTMFDDSISTYQMESEIKESPARNMLKSDMDCFKKEMKALFEYEERHPEKSLSRGLHRALKSVEDEFQRKSQQKETLSFEELNELRRSAVKIILCKKLEDNPSYSLEYYFKQYCVDEFKNAIINSHLHSEEEMSVYAHTILELKEVVINESRATNTQIDIDIIKKECSEVADAHLERIHAMLEKHQENSNELEKIFSVIEFVQEFLEEEQILQMQSLYRAYILNFVNAFMLEKDIDVKNTICNIQNHLKRFEEIYATNVSKEIVESQMLIIIEEAKSESVFNLLEERARLMKTEIITEPLEVLNNFQQARINWENRERTVYDFTTDYVLGNLNRSILSKKSLGILCENKERARQIQEKVDLIEEIYQACRLRDIESLHNAMVKIQEIYEETGCGKVILDELAYRHQKLEEEERTIYDFITDYLQGSNERSVLEKKPIDRLCESRDKAYSIQKEVDSIAEIYRMCNLENIESLEKSIQQIQKIYTETGCGKAILDELTYRYQDIDEKRRTVLGVIYATCEEAEREAKKVVGNKKFNSEIEAEQERERILREENRIKEEQERIKREQELEEAERKEILILEEQGFTNAQFLAVLMRRGFKSNYAHNKETKYKKEIWATYVSLKKKNYSSSMFWQSSVKIIFIILFVYFLLASVVALFATVVGGIILGVITYFLWRGYRSSQNKITKLKNDRTVLEEIESLFILQDGNVMLK